MGSNTKTEAVYDNIGAKYGIFKTLPTELIETSNLRSAIAPRISPGTGARALDLACGTGFYTRKLVEEWGFESAVGVDVSPRMVELATELVLNNTKTKTKTKMNGSATSTQYTQNGSTPNGHNGIKTPSPRIQFQVGDALSLGRLDSGPFDLVLGNWFLNYASTEEELTSMFESIATNLKDDGIFVGIAYPPTWAKDIDAFAEKENSVNERRKQSAMRISVRYIERNREMGGTPEGGWRTEVTAFRDDADRTVEVQFGNYHLTREVYESAARRGGLKGRLEFREVKLLDEVRGRAIERCGEEFWNEYFGVIGPHFCILIAEKRQGE